MMIKTASFGCGVDSVAGLLKYGFDRYQEIIFADTGSEKPETYDYLNFLMKEKGWPIKIVYNKYGKKLYDYYYDVKTFPTPFKRDCTGKFKIRPLRRYLREKYGKKETFLTDIFFDYSEYHRMKTSDVKYQTLNYPLVDDKITRDDCIKIIEDAGYPVPLKSGCYMCPFTKKSEWIWLKNTHNDLFKKTLALEKNAGYTKVKLVHLKGKESQSLLECACF